jgi:hypothetical protein
LFRKSGNGVAPEALRYVRGFGMDFLESRQFLGLEFGKWKPWIETRRVAKASDVWIHGKK